MESECNNPHALIHEERKLPFLFCNISWMMKYSGRSITDPPLGGGEFPVSEGYCGEECNFVPCDDGYVYGYFQTGEQQVRLERLGGKKEDLFLDGIDIVWTAPVEGKDPRVVVGWWRNSRLYRRSQQFLDGYPSRQHETDEINMFSVRAEVHDVFLLPPGQRSLALDRGKGWSGQKSWWYADDTNNIQATAFVQSVRAEIDGHHAPIAQVFGSGKNNRRAASAASDPYKKYVKQYETVVHPRHDKLQNKFKKFLIKKYPGIRFHQCFRDDLRYKIPNLIEVMVEIKPTDANTLRYAIRTAIGQLLDYRQQQRWKGQQLIVVENEVRNSDDLRLAFDNNFGLAWPAGRTEFNIQWP